MRSNRTILTLCAVTFGLATATLAHEFPTKAKQLKSSLVQNYAACNVPDTVTLTGGLPACGGDPNPIDTVCTFGTGSSDGSLTAKISGSGIQVKAKLKGLAPACDGQTLTVALGVRTTTDDCAGSHCVVADQALSGGTCTVADGRCTIATTIRGSAASEDQSFTLLIENIERPTGFFLIRGK